MSKPETDESRHRRRRALLEALAHREEKDAAVREQREKRETQALADGGRRR